MPALPLDAPLPHASDPADALVAILEQRLRGRPSLAGGDRRAAGRLAIPHLLRVMPIDRLGRPAGRATTAVGKDLSRCGIGLFHHEPLPHRHVLITFEDPRLRRLCVEVELNRCRFSGTGWYESGGRLLRVARPRHAGAALAG